MSKQPKKKRTKSYRGADAALDRPVVTRITAANRNKLSQYWFERKRFLKPIIIAVIVVAVVVWLAIELIRIITGA